jgi:predicted amidohydrolase
MSATGTFDVALCQAALQPHDDVDALVDQMTGLVERAGPADCYVFPELLGIAPNLRDSEALSVLDADAVEALHTALQDVAVARDALIVGGSYNLRTDDDAILNRAPIATPDAVVTYDKCRPIPQERDDGKVAGRDPPPVVQHNGVGVGVLICYDVEFPELARDVVTRGAEVLAVPSWTESEAGFQRVSRCSAARAVENQCYVATVPLVSDVAGYGGVGRSTIYAPTDDVLGAGGTRLSLPRDGEAAATCSVDVEALRRSREAASVRPYTDATEAFQ